MSPSPLFTLLFFFNDTATTEIYTLSLHDALPISVLFRRRGRPEPEVQIGCVLEADPRRRRHLRQRRADAARVPAGCGCRPETGRARPLPRRDLRRGPVAQGEGRALRRPVPFSHPARVRVVGDHVLFVLSAERPPSRPASPLAHGLRLSLDRPADPAQRDGDPGWVRPGSAGIRSRGDLYPWTDGLRGLFQAAGRERGSVSMGLVPVGRRGLLRP